MTQPIDLVKQVNKSGYPFQLRVEEEIRRTRGQHGWEVASREHPWRLDQTQHSGFIDIVLSHTRLRPLRLAIECKRIKSDNAQHLSWIFLSLNRDAEPTKLASCLELNFTETERGMSGLEPVWDNIRLSPASIQTEFCVLPGDEQRRSPILESLADDLLLSTSGLVQEELHVERSTRSSHFLKLFVFPVLVTNAILQVCRFQPDDVDIANGSLDASKAPFETVPFLRFRKSLATQIPAGPLHSLQAAYQARERTILVVNAKQ